MGSAGLAPDAPDLIKSAAAVSPASTMTAMAMPRTLFIDQVPDSLVPSPLSVPGPHGATRRPGYRPAYCFLVNHRRLLPRSVPSAEQIDAKGVMALLDRLDERSV